MDSATQEVHTRPSRMFLKKIQGIKFTKLRLLTSDRDRWRERLSELTRSRLNEWTDFWAVRLKVHYNYENGEFSRGKLTKLLYIVIKCVFSVGANKVTGDPKFRTLITIAMFDIFL